MVALAEEIPVNAAALGSAALLGRGSRNVSNHGFGTLIDPKLPQVATKTCKVKHAYLKFISTPW